ncbi:type I-F CRISPR-associated endoribonuclease Cas6/Csy4 [Zymobacter palmae]|uniref:type I-F CRISPR-associated endoribonuclease Cas6/Csy4 n=1 Tax=Zymobacter palmae TaxID=33074 RepID=UPI000486E580|nr:type I-F CRISPR-associated endoribonuclease Cas6/Csy4 [Zymobacter palmae]
MDHYIELAIVPDPEFSEPLLMNALFGKLHRVLAALSRQDIGVSFPGYCEGHQKRTLGHILRLHGTPPALAELMTTDWLKGMRDHLDVTECQPIPSPHGYKKVQRRQFKTNAERIRRRHASRHGETLEEARSHIPDSVIRPVELPFVQLNSQSTHQKFCLFISQGELMTHPAQGTFNTYGLSSTATIPWF